MRLRLVFWLLLASSLIWFCAMRRSVASWPWSRRIAGIFAVVDVQHPVASFSVAHARMVALKAWGEHLGSDGVAPARLGRLFGGAGKRPERTGWRVDCTAPRWHARPLHRPMGSSNLQRHTSLFGRACRSPARARCALGPGPCSNGPCTACQPTATRIRGRAAASFWQPSRPSSVSPRRCPASSSGIAVISFDLYRSEPVERRNSVRARFAVQPPDSGRLASCKAGLNAPSPDRATANIVRGEREAPQPPVELDPSRRSLRRGRPPDTRNHQPPCSRQPGRSLTLPGAASSRLASCLGCLARSGITWGLGERHCWPRCIRHNC